MIRVVLADDNYLVREGITALLTEVEEIELVDSVGLVDANVGEALGKLLQDVEIDAILVRRDDILEYVDHLIAKYGEDVVLAFP